MRSEHPDLVSSQVLPAELEPDTLNISSPDNSPLPGTEEAKYFQFTGSGREYFRIWIVNLCLSIATMGIYSAWAKVRRLQYFHRNTNLAGAVFDFHGNPQTILKGRLIAVVMLAAYNYAFGFSKAFGIVVVGFLLLALPWMMRNALRFRLRNTSYRGLRFNFDGSLTGAYRRYFPAVLLFVLPGLILAVDRKQYIGLGISLLLYLFWPLLHAGIKRYQHGNLAYGASRASYTASTGKFIKGYVFALLIGLCIFLVAGVATAGIGAAIAFVLKSQDLAVSPNLIVIATVVTSVFVFYFAYLLSVPYLQVRIYNLAWSNTIFPGVAINSNLRAWQYIKLQTVNAVLTLLSLGLYRPFAVVSTYRYRLAHTSVASVGAFDRLLGGERQRPVGAGGDNVADFLNFDLSW